MIIKGQARGRAKQLAAHLLRADENESVRLFECRGTLAQDVEGALVEMEARGVAARTQKPLYHASISPEAATPLTDRQVRQAVDLLEAKLGLHGLPRLVVLHRKKDRDHVHVVWCRVDAETGTAVHMSWNYRVHEHAARELEQRFGHRRLVNSFDGPKRRGRRNDDWHHARRSDASLDTISGELTALWESAADAQTFRVELAKAGYTLARGDRRAFVVIGRDGKVHSLARRINGASSAAVRARLDGLPLDRLPSVAEVREERHAKFVVGEKRKTFAAARREVGQRTTADRTPLHRTVRRSLVNLQAMVEVRATAVRQIRVPARRVAPRRYDGRPISNYRSQRAALVAEYASKIALALRNLPPAEIDAAIAALRSEREAALDRLKINQSIGGPKTRRPSKDWTPRKGSPAYLRMRFRSRTKRRPI